jgi:hypothetical protein
MLCYGFPHKVAPLAVLRFPAQSGPFCTMWFRQFTKNVTKTGHKDRSQRREPSPFNRARHTAYTMYYGYIQDICELDYSLRIQIPVFRCQWVKHPNSVNVNNYGLTLADLENVGHQDDPWVLADRVAQVFYVLNSEIGKHVVVSRK